MTRYLFGFMCVCALGVTSVGGCTDPATDPNLCEGIECDDGSECTEDACDPETGTCEYVALTRFCTFDDMAGSCQRGVCCFDLFTEPNATVISAAPKIGATLDCVPTLIGKLDGCVCEPNRCVAPVDCRDFNDCTQDLCNATSRCEHPAAMDGTPCAGGTCQAGICNLTTSRLPCTDQGIRNAVAAGGGPYTFDCEGATTVFTEDEILVETNVMLDGQGELVVDGGGKHTLFWVTEGAALELRGFGVTNGVGGLHNEGTLDVTDSTVSGNRAGEGPGGGIGNYHSGTLRLTNVAVSGNSSSYGGGIDNNGVLTLTNVAVSGNSSSGSGGGISNGGPGTLTLTNSTVSANSASWDGGGIYSRYGTLTLTNSTVSGNSANGDGSGIANPGGVLTLTSSTVSGDIHADGSYQLASITVDTTVIEGACTQGCEVPCHDGGEVTWISEGYNIESPGDTCGFDQTGDQSGVTGERLNLGPLANNGGPTMTHKPGDGGLGSDSAAIDQIPEADCGLTTDQRGQPRPAGPDPKQCDVGSVEVQAEP